MRPKRTGLWIGLISGLVVVGILAALIGRIPSTAQQISSHPESISIILSQPANGSSWPSDTPIPVSVFANGDSPIKNVELWTDGRLFNTQTLKDDQKSAFKVWSWMPLTEGTHTVFARATDANGQTVESNAVHIQATTPAGLITSQTTQEGETFQQLADQNGIAPAELAATNPFLDPGSPIPPGTNVFIPLKSVVSLPGDVPPLPQPPDTPTSPADEGSPSGLAFYLEDKLNLNSNLPAAPSLFASVDGCGAKLSIQDHSSDENGFFVYSLPETAASFQRIASLKTNSGASALQYSVPGLSGIVQFYVSSYNAAGESPSNPVSVGVTDAACNPPAGSQGDLKYRDGILTVPGSVQLAYFYGSMDGGEWQRVPSGDEFLKPLAGEVDLRSQIQQALGGQSGGSGDLDAWGWSDGALIHLGLIHIDTSYATLAICSLSGGCAGDAGATHWAGEATVGSDTAQGSRALRWKATGSNIDYAIWQVSTEPFPAEYSVGAPPGLLISGISENVASPGSSSARGDFSIDFLTDLQFPTSGDGQDHSAKRLGSLEKFTKLNPELLSQFIGGWTNPFALMAFQGWLPQILYIRAIPMAGGHPASTTSNTVLVSLQPTGEVPPIHISNVPTYSVEIVPGSYVNEVKVVQKLGTMGCSEVTGVDHDVFTNWYKQTLNAYKGVFEPSVINLLAENAYQFWADHIGDIACPGIVEDDDPNIFEQFAAAFEAMINNLSATFEQLKGILVGALAEIIPGCDQQCKSLLMTGLNFAITYFTGLPPSIPNFDQAVNMGIDYAVQMAISQAGIPYCDQTCQDAIKDKIKEVGSDVLGSSKSQPACADDGHTLWLYEGTQLFHLKPLCFPPGVSFDPVPGSMYENGMVQVKVTRIDGSPEPVPMQLLTLDTQALNSAFGDGHSATEYYQDTVQENCQIYQGQKMCASVTHTNPYDMVYSAPLFGVPYPTVSVSIPALKAGQSVVVPVVFKSQPYDNIPPNVYLPRAAAIQNAYPDADLNTVPVWWWRDFLHLTDSGSQITISGRVLCQDKSNQWIFNSPCSETDTQQFIVP
jgi:LysM repeat protein